MDTLPYEIVLDLFEFLPQTSLLNCLLLSKQFYVSAAAILYRKVSLDVDDFQIVKKRFAKPKKLYEDYRIYFKSFRLMAGNPTRLQLRQFLQPCSALNELILDFPCINDDDLWIITKSCPLTSLNLALDHQISDEGIMTICKNSETTLRHLVLKCTAVDSISERGMAGIASSFQGKLSTFSLEFLPSSTFHPLLSSPTSGNTATPKSATSNLGFVDALCSVFSFHRQLKSITLDWPINTSLVFKSIAENINNLDYFKVGNTSTSEELVSVLESNPACKTLSLFEINLNSIGIKEVFAPLDASSLTNLYVIGVCDFSSILPYLPNFTNLKTIQFSPTTRFASISPSQVLPTDLIAFNCPKLESLALPIHGDDALTSFANHCPRLNNVDVQDGRAISIIGITILVSKCKRLERLSLGFASLNDSGIDVLAKFCGERLIELQLPTPGKITSSGLRVLAEKMGNLETLLNLAPDIPMDAVLYAASKLCNLRQLGFGILRGRHNPFTKDEIDDIRKAGKRLRLIHFH